MINKNKVTILNAVSAVILTLVNGFLGIITTKMVIEYFGSDFNGLNSTANQIINVLLVLEGGFTLASNVVLFAPLSKDDYSKVNGILFVTREKFRKIGALFFSFGFIISVVYVFIVNSDLDSILVFFTIIITVIPSAFNLYYATTYRVLIQTMQKEYIINFANVITIGLGHITTIIMIICDGSVWMVRFITMIFSVINSILIALYAKKVCKFLIIKKAEENIIIPGTKDVMIQKITGIIYNSAPIVFLSIAPSGGTTLASVYAVYNNVFNMLKSLLRGIIDAPRLSIGQMLSEGKKERVWDIFIQYEFLAVFSIFTTMSTTYGLILPFISIYTKGIADANYYDIAIAVLMVLISVIEMLHIPCGHIINMAGEFRISKDFQMWSCIVLVITMTAGGIKWGVYGLLFSVLLVSILLAVLEIGYVHIYFFKNKIKYFFRIVLPYSIMGIITSVFERQLTVNIDGFFSFILYGFIITSINFIFALLIGFVFEKRIMLAFSKRILGLLKVKIN